MKQFAIAFKVSRVVNLSTNEKTAGLYTLFDWLVRLLQGNYRRGSAICSIGLNILFGLFTCSNLTCIGLFIYY